MRSAKLAEFMFAIVVAISCNTVLRQSRQVYEHMESSKARTQIIPGPLPFRKSLWSAPGGTDLSIARGSARSIAMQNPQG